jgi:hypothetical protein
VAFVDGHVDARPPRASTTGEAAEELGLMLDGASEACHRTWRRNCLASGMIASR